MPYRAEILLVEDVTHNVKRFIIEKPAGFKFTPGQATDVAIAKEGWEDKKRPFTFTSLQDDKVLEFTIKGYPERKGVTEQLHKLSPGDTLLIEDAWGAIQYKGPGIFIAGGAGITPFIAIFKDLARKGEVKGNMLIFSNKTFDDIILERELRHWLRGNAIFTLTREKREGYENQKMDEKFLKKHVKDFNQHFYICGPDPMVKDLQKVLEKLGAKSDSVVFEK